MKLLTTSEVAQALRQPESTVRYRRHRDTGPRSFKVGRRVLYNESDVIEWLDGVRDDQEKDTAHGPDSERHPGGAAGEGQLDAAADWAAWMVAVLLGRVGHHHGGRRIRVQRVRGAHPVGGGDG